MRTALFPGSFDPFTLGHMDILRSALTMFDRVIVAVGYNSAKSGFFHPDIRVQIIKDAIGTKGPRATTHITLPGRHVVLLPTAAVVIDRVRWARAEQRGLMMGEGV